MKENMLVSVIVPVYNTEKYIMECYESILAQTWKNTEIIFVNNNSTDGSAGVLEEIKKKNPSVILSEEKKQGAPAARNKGLALSKGTYIQFLDSDDLLKKDKLEHQLCLLDRAGNYPDIIHGDYIREFANGTKKEIRAEKNDVWLGLMKTRLGCTCSNLWKKTKLEEVGGWNENLKSSQEYDLMFRMMKAGAVQLFDDACKTVVRERTSGNISSENYARNWKTYCGLRIEIIAHLKKIKGHVESKYLQVLFDSIRQLYKYDKDEAARIFKNEFPEGFSPVRSEASSPSYIFLYRIFGFRRAEWLRNIAGKK